MEETNNNAVATIDPGTALSLTNDQSNKKLLGVAAQIEIQRANREVEAAVFMAQQFPRDLAQVREDILAECSLPSVAEKCLYSLPRGGAKIEGETIRLAEILARHYGNLQTSIITHSTANHETEKEIVVWDLEKRKRETERFLVPHTRYSKNGTTKIEAPNDVRAAVNAITSITLRNVIFRVVPISLRQDAAEACRRTIAKAMQNAETRARMLMAFEKELSVSQEMLEAYVGKRVLNFTSEDYTELRGVFNALDSGEAKVADFFNGAAPEAKAAEPTPSTKGNKGAKNKPADKDKPAEKNEASKAEEPSKAEESPKNEPPKEIKKGIF